MNNKGFTLIELIFTMAIFSIVVSLSLGMLVQSVKVSAKYLNSNDTMILFDMAEKRFREALVNAEGVLLAETRDYEYEHDEGDSPFTDYIYPDTNGKYNSSFDEAFDKYFGDHTNRHVTIGMEVIDHYSILVDILIYNNEDELIDSKQRLIKCMTARQMGNPIVSTNGTGIYVSPYISYYSPDEGADS